MAATYVRRCDVRNWSSDDVDGWQERPTITVFEADDRPAETGLVDIDGTPLVRLRRRIPIGFRGRA
jgi:hypothetical protein